MTSRNRRSLLTTFAAAGVAFAELRPALASGGPDTKTKTNGPSCRDAGHPCTGKGNVCCSGLICGDSGKCETAPNPTPPDTCPDALVLCITETSLVLTERCIQRTGKQDCSKLPKANRRRTCQRRKAQLRGQCSRTAALEAKTMCLAATS